MGKVRHESPTVSRPAIGEQAFLKGKMCIFELHDLDNSTVDAVALDSSATGESWGTVAVARLQKPRNRQNGNPLLLRRSQTRSTIIWGMHRKKPLGDI